MLLELEAALRKLAGCCHPLILAGAALSGVLLAYVLGAMLLVIGLEFGSWLRVCLKKK